MLMAVIFVSLAYFIYRKVQDHPPTWHAVHRRASELPVLTSLWRVLRNPQAWWIALYAGFIFAPTAAMGELWGVAYLEHGRHFGPHAAAFANGLIFIGWGIGGPVTGWLTDRMGKRKPLMLLSAFMGMVILSILLFAPELSLWQAYVLLFLFGMTNTGVAVAYAVSAEVNEKPVIGTSMAFTNMASVIVGAVLQPVIGYLIDVHSGLGVAKAMSYYQLDDFRAAMWILPICSGLGIFCTIFIRETYCRPFESALTNPGA